MNAKQWTVVALTTLALAAACFYRPWIIPGIQPTSKEVVENPGVNYRMKNPELVFRTALEPVPADWSFAKICFQLELAMILTVGVTAFLSFREPAGSDFQYVAVCVTGFCVFLSFLVAPILHPATYDYQLASQLGQHAYDAVYGEFVIRDRLFFELSPSNYTIAYRQLAVQLFVIVAIGSAVYWFASPPRLPSGPATPAR